MPIKTVIFGAGGHAKVVIDALISCGVDRRNLYVIDGNVKRHGEKILGYKIFSPESAQSLGDTYIHVAIGDGAIRERVLARHSGTNQRWRTVIHPAAILSASASIGAGAFIAAGAIVGPGSDVREGVIVNHAAVVDHDCQIDAFATISPGSIICGSVKIGRNAMIGSSATLLPGIIIGDGAVIGAGAVVRTSVPAHEMWVGVPARMVSKCVRSN